ncbi:MAG: hypothetical protein CVU44_22505 [Chloroflexi bacterium HGW-Chloroflexi-6]|nr:MAG: hypothetical protein CVU44_22505 [Chloroflexi bacterium HGW-Chloroflexi-6]
MKKQFKVILAIVLLATAALACGLPAIPGLNGPLLDDNFDGVDQNWGTGTDADSSVEYADGGLRFQLSETLFYVWSSPNDEDYSNVHIEVNVKNNSSDPNAAFGIICNQGVPDTNLYYFAVTSSGEYVIAKGAVAVDDVFLTNDDQWAASDLIAKNAPAYRIGADCGNGTLTLYVDGQQIDSVQDSSYSSGNVALFAWSHEVESGTDVTFDDFVITRLPSP